MKSAILVTPPSTDLCSTNWQFSDEKWIIFRCSKHRLCLPCITALLMRSNMYPIACYRANITKMYTPVNPRFTVFYCIHVPSDSRFLRGFQLHLHVRMIWYNRGYKQLNILSSYRRIPLVLRNISGSLMFKLL